MLPLWKRKKKKKPSNFSSGLFWKECRLCTSVCVCLCVCYFIETIFLKNKFTHDYYSFLIHIVCSLWNKNHLTSRNICKYKRLKQQTCYKKKLKKNWKRFMDDLDLKCGNPNWISVKLPHSKALASIPRVVLFRN